MKVLETERLILRNWEERDRGLFHEINADPQVMEFFPFRRDRVQSDARMDELRRSIETIGFGWFALALKDGDRAIGFTGLAETGEVPAYRPQTVEIGWRLARAHWGCGYATESAQALIDWGFETLGLPEIVAYAVAGNHRSIAVMKRLGLKHRPRYDFDHPNVGDDHPHLKRHVFYDLTRKDWLAQRG